MRFIELPFEKVLRICLLASGLVVAVIMTFVWKQTTFGTTPVMSTLWLAAEEAVVTVVFNAYHSFRMYEISRTPRAEASGVRSTAAAVPVLEGVLQPNDVIAIRAAN